MAADVDGALVRVVIDLSRDETLEVPEDVLGLEPFDRAALLFGIAVTVLSP
ncbi:hypothetical protein ACFWIJ_09435 [Streptomyces sp. NPDC127079]|uniref:hypothetical protein n=1 Tax=Streptomyces sp. NPDC127079 TaxID=3347132 RepID=UPI0036694AA1